MIKKLLCRIIGHKKDKYGGIYFFGERNVYETFNCVRCSKNVAIKLKPTRQGNWILQ